MKPRHIVPNVHLTGVVDRDCRLSDARLSLPDNIGDNAWSVRGSEKGTLLAGRGAGRA